MYSILEDLFDLSVQNFHQKNNFRIVFLCFPIPVPFVQCVTHDFIACEFASICLLFWYQPLHSWGWVAIQGSLFWSFTRWTISTCPWWPGLQKVFKSTLHPIVSTVSLPKLFLTICILVGGRYVPICANTGHLSISARGFPLQSNSVSKVPSQPKYQKRKTWVGLLFTHHYDIPALLPGVSILSSTSRRLEDSTILGVLKIFGRMYWRKPKTLYICSC